VKVESSLGPQTSDRISVYAVDDDPDLTDLYTTLLRAAGYSVWAFNERSDALASLEVVKNKPQLLITDYRGGSMPLEPFIHRCFAVHPALRILMASGFGQMDTRFSQVVPSRFIAKPFTPEEFLREVRSALAA
jgi:DNA-binding NtrC family response regulator